MWSRCLLSSGYVIKKIKTRHEPLISLKKTSSLQYSLAHDLSQKISFWMINRYFYDELYFTQEWLIPNFRIFQHRALMLHANELYVRVAITFFFSSWCIYFLYEFCSIEIIPNWDLHCGKEIVDFFCWKNNLCIETYDLPCTFVCAIYIYM